MKRSLVTLIILLAAIALAADVIHTYSLGTPVLKTEGEFSLLKLEGAPSYGNPGEPNLPWFGSKLLLAPGEEALEIRIKKANPTTFSLDKPIAPLQAQYPFSQAEIPAPVRPDAAIYTRDSTWPDKPDNGVNTQFLAGHPINFTAFCPFEYNPVTGALTFYQRVTVEVKTAFSAKAQAALSLKKEDAFTAQNLFRSVDNDEQVPRYETRTTGYEYLIIYDAAKQSQWQPFQELYTARGYSVLLKPVQEIIAQVAGADTQAKIRNYIISMYATNSLRHVLLAGDTDLIPHRGFYVNFTQGGQTDADIPADMYYSCLDGTWNADNDNFWGEYYECDLAAELSLGRFAYNSDAEIANFINKSSKYSNEPVLAEVKTALFVGEWLWDGPTWGGDYMDEMIGGSAAHGYTTVGVSTDWTLSTMYDRTYGYAEAWDGSQLRPLMSVGPTLINHLGHSNTTYCMRLSNNQVTNTTITNNGVDHNYSVIFSQGCYAGAFDNRDTTPGVYTSDCFTEKITSISTAAVAMIGHSRYGWGTQGSTDGASQYLHREYVDALFGEGIHELGFALADCKTDNIAYIQNQPVMYWVTFETNLIGDPGLMVWTDTPAQITAQLPSYWTVGLTNYQIQTNAPNASLRLKNGATILFEGTADATGLISINLPESLAPGTFDLYLNAPNFLGYHSPITVEASTMPYIVASQVTFLDADNLFHTGEQVNLDVTLKNVGMLNQLEAGMLTLTSSSPYIQILNGSYGFNALAAADSTVISGHFAIRIIGCYNDNYIANLSFTAQFDGYSASTPVTLALNAPHLELDSYQFVNSNPLILPGDNPSINLTVSNSGSGNAYSPLLLLFCQDPNITLSHFEVQLSPIGYGTFANIENAFNLLISPNAPLNSFINISYILSAENGNTLEGNFVLYLGLLNYSFENDMMGWTSSAPNTGFVNQWHRDNSRNSTLNGTYSLKFGGAGSGDYSNSAYGVLESPEFVLGLNSQLVFQHWMDAETHSSPQYAWDGGLVQISVNNGPWTQISPVGSYPHRIYNNPASPFPANTSVYSGSFDWTEATFDLANYSGTARFRFIFGSDGAVTGEGWYVDDIRVENENVANDDPAVAVARFELHENYPNPFNPETTISFSLPQTAPAKLEIFNVKGQIVRTLLKAELSRGEHKVVWNGLDDRNKPVGSGVYLYRLSSNKSIRTRRMMLIK